MGDKKEETKSHGTILDWLINYLRLQSSPDYFVTLDKDNKEFKDP
jgi:hypothetical protein